MKTKLSSKPSGQVRFIPALPLNFFCIMKILSFIFNKAKAKKQSDLELLIAKNPEVKHLIKKLDLVIVKTSKS